jgi:hypothetical protein
MISYTDLIIILKYATLLTLARSGANILIEIYKLFNSKVLVGDTVNGLRDEELSNEKMKNAIGMIKTEKGRKPKKPEEIAMEVAIYANKREQGMSR